MTKYNIRVAQESDKWMVLDWRNHEEVRAVMLTDHVIGREEHSAWWDKTMQMAERQILIFERNEVPVGVVTIYAWDQEKATAWWGFYLDSANLDQSDKTAVWLELEQKVIQYAGSTLKVYELYCESLRTNQLAWTLHQKCGFVECQVPHDASATAKDVVYMKYIYPENKVDRRPALYLFASHNTDFLSDILEKQSVVYPQFPYQIKTCEFGRYQFDLRDPENHELNSTEACYFFLERIEDFFPDIYISPTEGSLLQAEGRVGEYLSFIQQIASRGNRVFVADFALQKNFPYTIEEQLTGSSISMLIQEWNKALYELKKTNVVNVLPYAQLLNRVGGSFSNKYWYMARAPFSIQCLEAYSTAIIGSVFASHSLSARALILDLDNTLWKGIIGDDGMDGITLGGDYPGNIYKELQSLFLALKERGILLAICSKNTEEVAMEAIEMHPEMRLRKKDFVSWRINWDPKSSNIQELAAELNLGVQSLCFIDDNPVERAEVRRSVPGIFVPELPEDPADWYQFICQLPELWLPQINESDKRRAELYKKRVDIKKAEASFTDRSAFLTSLEMDIKVEALSDSNFERTHQLFNKTNQFNTTTKRYSKEQLKNWGLSDDVSVLHVKSKDKYAKEHEGVAALIVLKQGDEWIIDNFVMSCRVMGRDIEHALIKKLLYVAKQANIKSVVGRYIPSAKNQPVAKLYENNQFALEGENWRFDLEITPLPQESSEMVLNWNV
jgi:UDP-4-amino-4,6-dideoxy-N-acetyl-beta-L-altrosamine N-acetyltransferase